MTARFVPPGERVIIDIKPHPLFIVLVPLGTVLVIVALAVVSTWLAGMISLPIGLTLLWMLVLALVCLRLLWQTIEWIARSYVLTEKRVIRLGGVFRRYGADIPLHRLQHVTMFQSIRERLFGLGTLGFATAGTGNQEAYWIMVPRPRELLQVIRDTADGATRTPVTIGLAGAIGAGKSTVARLLADLGCVVSDSDVAAKAALDRDDVRDALVEAFGDRVLTDGRIDRGALADVVFDDDDARRRLQDLTHPIVNQMRREQFEQATDARAYVIDAPLLFEAGVDAECDLVIFVDAPTKARLERVSRTRGWSEKEVERREKAQLPVETKRRRADHIVVNDADEAVLASRLSDLLDRIERDRAASGST